MYPVHGIYVYEASACLMPHDVTDVVMKQEVGF